MPAVPLLALIHRLSFFFSLLEESGITHVSVMSVSEAGKPGRKPLHRTAEERRQMKVEWEAKNPERCWEYKRRHLLRKALQARRMPSARMIERYSLTREDLEPLWLAICEPM